MLTQRKLRKKKIKKKLRKKYLKMLYYIKKNQIHLEKKILMIFGLILWILALIKFTFLIESQAKKEKNYHLVQIPVK